MVHEAWVLVAQIATVLVSVYWVCLIVGGGLLIVSTIAGGHGDSNVSGDFHVDAGADVSTDVGNADLGTAEAGDADIGHGGEAQVSAGALAKWFSLRFLVFFLATFGLVGVVLTHLTQVADTSVLASAFLGGFVVGQGVHQLLRKLQRTSGDSTLQPQDYLNKPGRVTIRIDPPKTGEVAIHIAHGERFVPAVSRRTNQTFKVGEPVYIVAYAAGIAEVISRDEYEFLTEKA